MKDVSQPTIERVHQQYLAICAAGYLRPAQRVEESSMRVEDRLAGDNRYVFLSVNEANWGPVPAQAQFGFIFDAPTLIDQGAILRPYDLHDTYRETLNGLAAEEIGWYTWRDAIPQDMEKYRDRHCAFLKALRSLDETVLGVQHVLIRFRQKTHVIQRQANLQGKRALAYLAATKPDKPVPELLIEQQLSLDLAMAALEYGKTVRLRLYS